MARRKGEIQLQQEIETQEEWEDMLSKEGLFVVDVYAEWAGPCTCIIANLRRLKNELGDDSLHFAVAKADTIDALEKYRGHCEPCFLFFAGGVLVAAIRGANSPKVLRTITEQLAQEHKVMDGQSERKEIKDPFIAELESEDLQEEEEKEEEEDSEAGKKEITVCLIKPDAVQAGKADEIIEDIKSKGIEVLKHEERTLTEDEVKTFYSHLQEEAFFEDMVKFMTSGPSHVLVLTKGRTGDNIISEFRDLIGPTSVEEAKEQNPESLRAKHGEKDFMNALHGSSSEDMAMKELAFFFPDFVVPEREGKPKVQRTLALIRPDAFKLHKDEVLQKIRDAGFEVAMQKEMQLTKEMAEDFYKEHAGQDYFEELTNRMSSGPVLALGLAREDAVEGWRGMLGPKEVEVAKEQEPDSLRAMYSVEDTIINQFHGSDSEESAKKELEFFFPMQQTVAVIKPDAIGTKEEIIDKIHDAGFRIAARKETTLSRDIAEEFYADHKDKDYYEDLVEHMTSGPTMFMVLSREDAVEGWRSVIGPTDPEKAKEENPNSLRAAYGQSILQNAIHGSSTVEHAKDSIKKIFGDLEFNADGTVKEGEEGGEKEGEEADQKPEGEQQVEGGEQTMEQQQKPDSEQPELEQKESSEEQPSQPDAAPADKEEAKTEDQAPAEPQTEQQPSTEGDTKPDAEPAQEESKPEEKSEEAKEEAKGEESKPEEQKAESPKPAETEQKAETATEETQQKEETATEEKAEEKTEPETKPEGEEEKEEEKKEEAATESETKQEEEKKSEEETKQEEKKEEETPKEEGGGN